MDNIPVPKHGEPDLIRTSQKGWLLCVTEHYKNKSAFKLIDDAEVGISPDTDTIFEMGRKAGLSSNEWIQICGCAGVGGIGLTLIFVAFFDPEPTSKLGLLVGGGVFLAVCGGLTALSLIIRTKPPTAKIDLGVFSVSWG